VPAVLLVRSLKELMAHAKANPGKLNWGDVGPGDTLIHFEIMKQVNRVDIQKIVCTGSAPTIDALIRNELQFIALPEFTTVPLVREVRARAVAVSGGKRLAALARVKLWNGNEAWLVTRYEEFRAVLKEKRISAEKRQPNFPSTATPASAPGAAWTQHPPVSINPMMTGWSCC
jgi:tripartite-type tricarboxylate transporter receptor subunit TctC